MWPFPAIFGGRSAYHWHGFTEHTPVCTVWCKSSHHSVFILFIPAPLSYQLWSTTDLQSSILQRLLQLRNPLMTIYWNVMFVSALQHQLLSFNVTMDIFSVMSAIASFKIVLYAESVWEMLDVFLLKKLLPGTYDYLVIYATRYMHT